MLEAAQRERPGYVFEVTDRKAMNCLEERCRSRCHRHQRRPTPASGFWA